jgi:hypothetical protein
MTLQQAQKARADALALQRSIDNPPFASGVSDMEYDFNSMGTAAADYGVTNLSDYQKKYGTMYDSSGQSLSRGGGGTPAAKGINVNSNINPGGVPAATRTTVVTPAISQKVQVGKLVSDFKV